MRPERIHRIIWPARREVAICPGPNASEGWLSCRVATGAMKLKIGSRLLCS